MANTSRSGERRAAERRRAAMLKPRPVDESWFGALGVDGDTQLRGDTPPVEDESRYDGNWAAVGGNEGDSRFLTRQARRIIGSGQTAFQRIYGAFIAARAALGVALIATVAVTGFFGVRPPLAVLIVSVVYAALAVSTWLLPRLRQPAAPKALSKMRSPQWLATIGVDIVCFIALHVLSPAATLNYVALLVLPVLMAGVLTPRTMALATAAIVTLALLGIAGWAWWRVVS